MISRIRYELAGLMLVFPLAVFAAEPSQVGVWKGMLGKSNIVACINSGQDYGSYYYETHRIPIQLVRTGRGWREADDTGRWDLEVAASGVMVGTWNLTKGGISLPIKLTLASGQSDPQPCASDAYNALLEIIPRLQVGAKQTFNEYSYRTLRVANIETVELLSPAPAQQLINRQLKNMLPKSIQDLGDYFAKRRGFLGRSGSVAEDEQSATVEFWNREFVTVRFHRWAAGEGRRGAQSDYLTWDLRSGKPVNPWDWFTATPRKDSKRHRLVTMAAHAPECKDGYYGEGDFQLTLEADAVHFWEEAYGDGCERGLRIPYTELSPILSAKGKVAIARMLVK